jgi:3-phosphoshikimate 1-carboxyvinyltransferase
MTAGDQAPATLTLTGPCAVQGTLQVPGDKSISHRALILAGLASGESVVNGLSQGDDVTRTRQALAALGVAFTGRPDGSWRVRGGSLSEPAGPLDHGNSGTGLRLMAGVTAGLDMFTVLTGDEYLRQRPMGRVVSPLREMGARVDGRAGGSQAPLAIRGGTLRGIRYPSPVASAQVKSAVLLAGLGADGPTTVVEPVATRRHTEEMLADFGGQISVNGTVNGTEVTLTPGALSPTTVRVPGDPSQAAFWAVAALVSPDGEVVVENLYLGHGRTGYLDVLTRMGATVDVDRTAGTIRLRAGTLRGTQVGPAEIPSVVDEVPILAVAAAAASGTTVLTGAAELRVKESDRIKSTAAMLQAFGASVTETAGGLVIEGGRPLRAAVVDSFGDHRIAMAAAVAALRASGTTTIHGWESVSTSYPGFVDDLKRVAGASVRAQVSAG